MTTVRSWCCAVLAAIMVTGCSPSRLTIALHSGVEGIPLKLLALDFARERRVPVEIVELPYDQLYEETFRHVHGERSRFDSS